ncbi:MAG: selenocysteine-specific translation elongation factor [Desulfobacca sp. 4484_104]|nr:MAG: selenocysteine-specific translation elongation factor [Desulfobacca sp. 4484_104]
MNQIILGTAGHIDHGKTALIKALTGVDTDRLKEEKRRGITIELGFASLTLPSGQRLGIVDVPGHERFVRHMVAGATGMDLVALIIAADEGVMPQTREHLEICQLLKVKQGLVVLTKTDLVDEEWLALVEEEVQEFLRGTFLEGAPIVRFSAVSGAGQEELLATLTRLSQSVAAKPPTGIFRLPIDRVFTIKGFGTVVTGTAISGVLRVGEMAMIYPPGLTARVRNLQVHGVNVEVAMAGARTAVNLQGLEKSVIERGMVVATPGTLLPSHRLDARLEVLHSAPQPLKNRQRLRLHTGTDEQLVQIIILSQEELKPGESGYVQFRLSQPLAVKPGDRLVVRRLSPVITLGGGQILHVHPPYHRRLQPAVLEGLARLESGSAADQLRFYFQEAGIRGLAPQELAQLSNLDSPALAQMLNRLGQEGQIVVYDAENQRYVLATVIQELKDQIQQQLVDFHRRQPLKLGLSKEELRRKLPPALDVRLFNYLVQDLERQRQVVVERELIRQASHRIVLAGEQESLLKRLEQLYQRGGLTPPTIKDTLNVLQTDQSGAQELINLLVAQGRLVKVKEGLMFHQEVMAALKNTLVGYLKDQGEISVPQFKDLTNTSRKYTIPLLEYFDACKLTVRVGDRRRLRESS